MARTAAAYGGVVLLIAGTTAYLGFRHVFDPPGRPQVIEPRHDFLGFFILYLAAAWLGWWIGSGSGGILARIPVSLLGLLACWSAYCLGFVVLPFPGRVWQFLHWSTGSWFVWFATAFCSTIERALRRRKNTQERSRFSFLQMMTFVCGSGVITFAARTLMLSPQMQPAREALQSLPNSIIFGLIAVLQLSPWLWAVHSTRGLRLRASLAGCLSCMILPLLFVLVREQLLDALRVNPAREPPIVWLELFAVTVGGFVGPALLLAYVVTRHMSAQVDEFFATWQRRRASTSAYAPRPPGFTDSTASARPPRARRGGCPRA